MITKKECLVWMSYDENDCKPLSVASLDNKLNLALVISQGGAGAVSSKPSLAQIGLGFTNIECGIGHLIKSVESALPYEATNIKMGDLGMDNGRIDCLYTESFIVDNQEGDFLSANGPYKMTTKFYNNKPTYTNENGWWITWNGTDWSMTDGFPPSFTTEIKNESSEPNQGVWNSGNLGPVNPVSGNDFCVEEINAKYISENNPRVCTPDEWKSCLGRSKISRNGNVIVMSTKNDTQNDNIDAHSSAYSVIVLVWDGSDWVQRGTPIHGEGWLADRGRINASPEKIDINDDGTKIVVTQMYNDSVSNELINSVRVWEWRQFQESDIGNYYHYNLFQDVNTAQKKKTIITYDKSTDDPVTPVVGEYYWTQRGNDVNSRFYATQDSSQIYQVTASSDFNQLFILAREPITHTINVQRVFEWNDEADDWIQKGFDIQFFRSSAYYQNRRMASCLSGDKFVIEAWNANDLSEELWIMVFEWRQFTDADIFKYVHGTRAHDSNKPIIITGDGPNGSTDIEPVSGEFYWTQVGLTIEEKFDESYNAPATTTGIVRQDWTMALGTGRNYDLDENFETMAILNSGKTVCFYKLQKVGQNMRWVKQENTLELPKHIARHQIVLSNEGNRILVVGEGPATAQDGEISVYGSYFDEDLQIWINSLIGQPLDFILPVDRRRYFRASDAIKKVNNDFVWSLDGEIYSGGERGSVYFYKTTQNCIADGPQGPAGSYSIFGDKFVNGYDTTTMFFRIEKSSNISVGDVVIVNDVNFTYEYCGTEQPTIDLNGTTGEVTKVTEDGDYIDIEFLHNQDVTDNCAGTYSSGGTITLQN